MLNSACAVSRLSPFLTLHHTSKLGWTRGWEGTQLWQLTQGYQRDIPYYMTLWATVKLWEGFARDCRGCCCLGDWLGISWLVVSNGSDGFFHHLFFFVLFGLFCLVVGFWGVGFGFFFFLPIKLSLSQPTTFFLIFTLLILSPIPLGEIERAAV